MLLPGLYEHLLSAPAAAVQAALAAPASGAIFEISAMKGAPRPFLVLNRISAPPAGATLDGTSDLIDGEIQFDAYADTPAAAEKLAHAVRDFYMRTFVVGQLPDGTNIQFIDVTADHDEGYEPGGSGFLYRALLRLQAFYTEAS